MNKKTKALTTEQYKEIIQTMREGFSGCRPNERIATALVLEGNLGLRISDILKLRPCDIVRVGHVPLLSLLLNFVLNFVQLFSVYKRIRSLSIPFPGGQYTVEQYTDDSAPDRALAAVNGTAAQHHAQDDLHLFSAGGLQSAARVSASRFKDVGLKEPHT